MGDPEWRFTPLMMAATIGSPACVRALLAAKADVSLRSKFVSLEGLHISPGHPLNDPELFGRRGDQRTALEIAHHWLTGITARQDWAVSSVARRVGLHAYSLRTPRRHEIMSAGDDYSEVVALLEQAHTLTSTTHEPLGGTRTEALQTALARVNLNA